MSAIPIPDPAVEDHRERILLRGDLPSPANPPKGVPLPHSMPLPATDPMRHRDPALRPIEGQPPERKVTCHYAEQILSGEITVRDPSLVIEAAAT